MSINFFSAKDKFKNLLKSTLRKNMNLVIDRFEENIAVCERQDNGKMIDIDRNLIPENATEGMAIKFDGEKYFIDYQNCLLTRKQIIDSLKDSWVKEDGAEYYFVSSVLENAIKCSNIFIKQNVYIKDEELIKTMKKGDIVKLLDEKYIVDQDKNFEIEEKIKELINN